MASSARPRDPGWRNRGDAAPRCRVPAPSRTLLAGRAEGRPARPGHRQFTARGLRLPAAVTITICKALPADAHLAEPTGPRSGRGAARRSEFQGPGPTVNRHRGPRGLGLAGLSASPSGGSPPTLRGACDGGASAAVPTDSPRPGTRREVEPLPPRYCQGLSPGTVSRRARGRPRPRRLLSRAGPAPSLPPPPSFVRIAHPGTRLSAPNVLMGGSPPPPSFRSRSSCPRRPGGPWRALEPSRWPRSGMPAHGGHPARSARRLPASSLRSGMRGLTPIPPAPRISPAPYWGRSAPPGRGKTWSPARPPPPPPRSPPSPRRRYNPIPRRG